MAKLIAGKLEVVEAIDRGDGTPVYKVRHPLLDALLTVTTLPAEMTAEPAQLARLQHAVRAAFELRHGHIVQVVDLVEDAGHYQLVEAFVAGEPLDRLLRTAGPLPPADALLIARQVADALAHAHDRGVVHGAVTPARILVEQGVTPRAMLAGFATAGLAPAPLAYCAPERLAPAAEGARLDPGADIFALGVVIFEMLEGRAFFAAASEEEMLDRLGDGSAPLLPQFSRIPLAGVSALVARAIRRAPAERQQTMEQMRREIDACLRRLVERKYASAKDPEEDLVSVVAKRTGPAVGSARGAQTRRAGTALPKPRPAAPESRPTRKITLDEIDAESWDVPAATASPPVRPQTAQRRAGAWRTAGLAVGAIAAALLAAGLILRPSRLALEWVAATPRREAATATAEPAPPTPAVRESAPSASVVRVAAIDGKGDAAGTPVATPRTQPNEAPRIISTQPRHGETLTLGEGTSIDFSARATDKDPNDRLVYAWFLGGREVSRRERWRFVVPSLETATAHTVELRVADTAGAQAPPLAWSIQVSPRISDADVQAWLRRYEAAWEQKDLATLRVFGAVSSDAAASELANWLRRQKGYRVAIDNPDIRRDGSHASVVFDRADFDEEGRMLVSKRESFELEKQPDGSVTVRTR